jgi:dephospho-CoA kinase
MTIQLQSDRYFVITGGPGAGKGSLIEMLAAAGYARTVEAGRATIQQQLAPLPLIALPERVRFVIERLAV